MPRLKSVMRLVADNDTPLSPEWSDDTLKGQWSNHRECHRYEQRIHNAKKAG